MPTGASYPTGPAPAYANTGGSLQVRTKVVVDQQTTGLTGQEAGNGTVTLTLPTVPSGQGFEIERVDLWSDSDTTPTVNLYIGTNPTPPNEIDYSLDGNHDLGDFHQPIYVPSGSTLTLLWSGLASLAHVTARVQYSVVQYVAVTYS